MKKGTNILIFNWNNVLTDVIAELKKQGHTILPEDGKKETLKKADVIVVWNETELGGWRGMIKELKKKKKRVVLVQHGRKGTSRIYPPFNETLVSDVVCVWGENDKQRLMSVGTPEDKIKVCGTPIFQHLKPRVKHKGYNVVFSPEHWDKDVSENWIVAKELRKLKRLWFSKINIITKGLSGEQLEPMYDNFIGSDRSSPEHFSVIAEVLSKADLVVGISESTFELLAQSLDIPVVIADVWEPKACDGDERYKDYHREYSNAVAKVPLEKLNETIKFHLKHPEFQRKERAEVVKGDGGDVANPTEEIIKVICNTK
jgi:hypothetical protein